MQNPKVKKRYKGCQSSGKVFLVYLACLATVYGTCDIVSEIDCQDVGRFADTNTLQTSKNGTLLGSADKAILETVNAR